MHKEELVFTAKNSNVFGDSEATEKWLNEGNEMIHEYIKDKEWVPVSVLFGILMHHDPHAYDHHPCYRSFGEIGITFDYI